MTTVNCRIWVRALTRAWRADRLATIRTRMASTAPSLELALARTLPDRAARAAWTGIDRVGLALATTVLAVVPIDLDHLDPGSSEEPGQSGPIGTGPFHADFPDSSEADQPRKQGRIALRSGMERFGAE